MSPLQADFVRARVCKLICEKILHHHDYLHYMRKRGYSCDILFAYGNRIFMRGAYYQIAKMEENYFHI